MQMNPLPNAMAVRYFADKDEDCLGLLGLGGGEEGLFVFFPLREKVI